MTKYTWDQGAGRLDVSVVGLGCGGHSRLGMATGKDEAHATRIVEASSRPGREVAQLYTGGCSFTNLTTR